MSDDDTRPLKVYRIEIMVVDFAELGEEEIVEVLQTTKYPNWCMHPKVIDIEAREVQWNDGHPLNNYETVNEEFVKLFKEG
ncbi:hypothetical protein HC928_02345 [bacterium]|nr:hypothetical protein [bacterium]